MRGARIGATPRRGLPIRRILRYLISISVVVLLFARLFFVELVIARGSSMAPTVLEGDVLIINRRASPRVGDLVIVKLGERAVLRRILATSGTRIATVDGVLALNESALDTRMSGTFAYHDSTPEADAKKEPRPRRQTVFVERLPDGRHHDALGDHVGASKPWLMELPETEVPPGHVFVLCDNRRRCPEDELSGVVSLERISGVASYLMWYGDARVELPSDRSIVGAFKSLRSR